VLSILPPGTHLHCNIPYANDTLQRHLLDIYVPGKNTVKRPVVIWFHGGGWRKGDKNSAMDNMDETVREMIQKKYTIVSVNYRYSSTDKFPAQIQDCYQAVEFIYEHAAEYNLDRSRIAVMGFSAGGHLAALLGLSNDNKINDFYPKAQSPRFKVKLIIDYYGISDLVTLTGPGATDPHIGVTLLTGASAADRPDLSRKASPIQYIDKNDPPCLIFHGDRDEAVSLDQSILLKSELDKAGVKNELMVIKGAPHAGPMFDTENVRRKLFTYLHAYLR